MIVVKISTFYQLDIKCHAIIRILLGVLILSSCPFEAYCQGEAQEIAKKEYERDLGKTSLATLTMTLKDKRGHQRVRKLIVASKFVGNIRQQYVRFDSPKSIAGTSFLSMETAESNDDQFLFLPAAGRVRRIVSGQMTRSFANTDYSYEDMQRRNYSRDTFELLGAETVLGRPCFKIRRQSVEKDDSQYSYIESCIAKEIYVTIKATFFDEKQNPVKYFEAHNLEKIQGIWTITDSEFKNLQKGTATRLQVQSIKYNGELPDEMFTTTYLKTR